MARTIILQGEPVSTQHIYRPAGRGRFLVMTNEGKAVKQGYQWEAKAQWKGAPCKSPMRMSAHFYFKNFRKRDLDNFNKLVLDALTGIAYEDDHQIDELHLFRRHDSAKPHVEIVLEEIGAAL